MIRRGFWKAWLSVLRSINVAKFRNTHNMLLLLIKLQVTVSKALIFVVALSRDYQYIIGKSAHFVGAFCFLQDI